MTLPPPAPHPGGEAAPSETGTVPPSRARWIARMSDRVPTGWFAGILTAAFLGVTAAFGGLSAVAAPPIPELAAGDTHENAQFAITIDRAVLIDELPEAGIFLEEGSGQRVLAVVLTVENLWTEALSTGLDFVGDSGIVGSVRIADDGYEPAESVARFDDATVGPWLQPGIPAELVLTWPVDADAWADGDELRLELRDFALRTGQLVVDGQYWDDPVTAAYVTVDVADVGSGAEPEQPSDGVGE